MKIGDASIKSNDSSSACQATSTLKENRDFKKDLENYLELWSASKKSSAEGIWKFNKVLQSWGVSNILDKGKISASLFKLFCPYLATIQGAARDRIKESMTHVIDKYVTIVSNQIVSNNKDSKDDSIEPSRENTDNNNDDVVVTDIMFRRARKIMKLLSSE